MNTTAVIAIMVVFCLVEGTHAFTRKSRAFKTYVPSKRAGLQYQDGVIAASVLEQAGDGDVTIRDMVDMLISNPQHLEDVVATYLDKDRDGMISARELLESRRRRR